MPTRRGMTMASLWSLVGGIAISHFSCLKLQLSMHLFWGTEPKKDNPKTVQAWTHWEIDRITLHKEAKAFSASDRSIEWKVSFPCKSRNQQMLSLSLKRTKEEVYMRLCYVSCYSLCWVLWPIPSKLNVTWQNNKSKWHAWNLNECLEKDKLCKALRLFKTGTNAYGCIVFLLTLFELIVLNILVYIK